MKQIHWSDSLVRNGDEGGRGEFVQRDGETFYKISNYDKMPPFFLSVVSGSDHWMFVSSTGGLTCGRRSPENALFPYYTDDKIHDACSTTGALTNLLVQRGGKTYLWKPFFPGVDVYDVERNLYKNRTGNKLIFEELNRDLELTYSYAWSTSERFGFVKKARVVNFAVTPTRIEILDGLRNLLPYGVFRDLQATMSTLVDAYKQAESIPGLNVAVYTLSSIPTDRAEPSEALKATVAWSLGLDQPKLLLSEDQVSAFCAGMPVSAESFKKGKRGAFFLYSAFSVSPGAEKDWYILADINMGPSDLPALLDAVNQGISSRAIEQDIDSGTQRLLQLAGGSDGCQLSSDALVTGRHFSNTLFNIMRGGTFYDDTHFPPDDFLKFVETWNTPLREKFETLLNSQNAPQTRASLIAAAETSGDADFERLALEYLPLVFSRRHGDPSRPWNQFSIDLKEADGSDTLSYEGNWRDIFQNWEALALSYPEYIESFIAKFVNASTADGYNPYRIRKDGFDWEVLDPNEPWSNIGYWGDHQVNYLLSFLELSCRYHPGKIEGLLAREVFVYANVPYRLKGYRALLSDPRNTVEYDELRAQAIAGRVEQIGSDGKLVSLAGGSIYKVNLLEKLLVSALSRVGNLVPGGGIWMNTQRPEWNDANNALVGYGSSMVTLCYLRRYLSVLAGLLTEKAPAHFAVSNEVLRFFTGIQEILRDSSSLLDVAISPKERKVFMDRMGPLAEEYRESIYRGFSGNKSHVDTSDLLAFIDLAMALLDHSIAHNRRVDGLFHSYNLIHFDEEGYSIEYLDEMLEGQVAVLNSGYLNAQDGIALLDALRASNIYRSDQNSYLLYPDRKLPLFLEKNVIAPHIVADSSWIQNELQSGRRDLVEQDVNGSVHFNGALRNAEELSAALATRADVGAEDSQDLCRIYELVFRHRQFTGRSGAMYKYEGLGCIYWHMVSKLLLATGKLIAQAARGSAGQKLPGELFDHYDEIRDGLGVHKTPARYGAFPVDPYSHTPSFAGVQQPGMTGQVKEDVISRFGELGVSVHDGEIEFSPIILKRSEFLAAAETWRYSVGGAEQSEQLEAGSLAFSICGVPVIYRMAENAAIRVLVDDGHEEILPGSKLGQVLSQSVFRRENRLRKIIVDVPEAVLR